LLKLGCNFLFKALLSLLGWRGFSGIGAFIVQKLSLSVILGWMVTGKLWYNGINSHNFEELGVWGIMITENGHKIMEG